MISDPYGDEFLDELNRQFLKVVTLGVSAISCVALPSVISCGSAILSHINYFMESVYPEYYEENGYLSKAGELLAIADCLEGLGGLTKLDKLSNIPSCALTILEKFKELEEEHLNKLKYIVDNWDINIPRKDVNDYIKINTKVSEITSNSAMIIGELSIIGDGNRKYSIRFQGAEWGYNYPFTDGKQIDPNSISFIIHADNLIPDTPYGARAYIITDYYEDGWGKIIESNERVDGNIVDFKTLSTEDFLTLSTYDLIPHDPESSSVRNNRLLARHRTESCNIEDFFTSAVLSTVFCFLFQFFNFFIKIRNYFLCFIELFVFSVCFLFGLDF